VLAVGIDWPEEFHLVALGRPSEGVFELRRVAHSPSAVDALVARIAELEPDPAEVRVVLEARHGLLVERLVDAGYVVVPVNPRLIARSRGPARKKDEDARIACLLALDRFEHLRPLIPHGELAGELRAIARDDERAAKDERRLLNRLRADLTAVFPAALAITGQDIGAPTFPRLLGAPRRGRSRTPKPDEIGESFPGGEVYPSMPGLGERLAARVAGEIGDHPEQFESPSPLQCYAGKAPVTRRSGKSGFVVACRLAYNHHLGDAVQQRAFRSLRQSAWAREFYDRQRAKGNGHHAALRALGNRWLEVLWHCLDKTVPYDEAAHVANRNRALSKAPLAA